MKKWMNDILEEHKLYGVSGHIVAAIAIACSCFFLYTSYYGSLPNIAQRGALMLFALPMIFLQKPLFKNRPKASLAAGIVLSIAAVVSFYYVISVQRQIAMRVGNPNQMDQIMAVIAILLVILATKLKVGWTLPILVAVLTAYAFLGRHVPGVLMHRGVPWPTYISSMYLSEEGIFGTPLQVASDFIMVFVLFGAFLRVSGAGEFFIDIADAGFGYMRGGPAKAAVVSSALMGTISGSAVANVVTTGTFTIPLMKKTGYKPEFAGAVEAVASTGGQIMPPIMGAAAFIMADFLGVPYWDVVKAAIIPALLYYLAVYFMVDLEAAHTGLKGTPKDQLPNIGKTLRMGWYLLIPIAVLIVMLGVVRYSAQKSAFFTIVVVLIVSMFGKHTRMTAKKFITALIEGVLGGLEVAAVCACAGLVIGVIMRTGLGMTLTGMLIELASGKLVVLMILTMVSSIIMGMGLPTSACYIIVVVLIAPAMVQMGVPKMAAHMFAFYFACLSNITPPVAMAAYAAAGIAESSPMQTGIQATRVGLCGFIVPYMFVFGPALLMIGSPLEIAWAVVTATIGTYMLSAALIGYMFGKMHPILRITAFVAALVLIYPGFVSDVIGFALITVVVLISRFTGKNRQPHGTTA